MLPQRASARDDRRRHATLMICRRRDAPVYAFIDAARLPCRLRRRDYATPLLPCRGIPDTTMLEDAAAAAADIVMPYDERATPFDAATGAAQLLIHAAQNNRHWLMRTEYVTR